MAYGLEHPANLSLAAFADHHAVSDLVASHSGKFQRGRLGHGAVQNNSPAQITHAALRQFPGHGHQIFLFKMITGVHHPVGHQAVIGHDKKTIGVLVEASHGKYAGSNVGHKIHDCRRPMTVGYGDHDADRFVEGVVFQFLRNGDGFSIHEDSILFRINRGSGQGQDQSIDGDPAGGDEFLALSSCGHPAIGHEFMQSNRHAVLPGTSDYAPFLSASFSASLSSIWRRRSRIEGRSARRLRPNTRKKSSVVP